MKIKVEVLKEKKQVKVPFNFAENRLMIIDNLGVLTFIKNKDTVKNPDYYNRPIKGFFFSKTHNLNAVNFLIDREKTKTTIEELSKLDRIEQIEVFFEPGEVYALSPTYEHFNVGNYYAYFTNLETGLFMTSVKFQLLGAVRELARISSEEFEFTIDI